MAGAMAQTLIYPMEVVKTRMVLRSSGQYRSVFNCIKSIYRDEGIRTFGRGYVPTVFGIFPYAGLDLLFAETMRHYMQQNQAWAVNKDGNLHTIFPFLIGGTSSMCAGSLVYPVNLIRTKVKNEINLCYGLRSITGKNTDSKSCTS
jgi:solute carrier family 25 phosphate transporter 23/24/25/41